VGEAAFGTAARIVSPEVGSLHPPLTACSEAPP